MPILTNDIILNLLEKFDVSFQPNDSWDRAGSSGLIDVTKVLDLFSVHDSENIHGLYTTYALPDGKPFLINFSKDRAVYAPQGRPLGRGKATTESKLRFTRSGFELVDVGTEWEQITPLVINESSRYVSFQATSKNSTNLFIDSAEMGM